ncbi:hypothetical protein G7046_g3062 [Stylonectria norvegica]|nr:hypothetical protein G7046_g3062 [Stylonectria norvegica]
MSELSNKKRKIRKGTRSCWECRRRKIKCQFNSEEDATCVGCVARETVCVSQEFIHDVAPVPDRRLAQRLGRLEELMEKLVDRTEPGVAASQSQKLPSPSASDGHASQISQLSHYDSHGSDVFEISAASNAQQVPLLARGDCDLPVSSVPNPCFRTPARVAKFESVSRQIRAAFPSIHTMQVLSQESPGARYVLSAFYSQQDQIDGKPEHVSSLTEIPPVTYHPAILAKRLLQLAVCLQQLQPDFDISRLRLVKPLAETMEGWVNTVSTLVTSDDNFIGCLEGLECLILLSFHQSDAGHLRKAWMTSRRALNLAQLMGIDRKTATSVRSCDPTFDPKRQPSAGIIWFRINCSDRYLSLILGLSIGSRDNSFMKDPRTASVYPFDKLGKAYSVIAGRIAERNELSGSEAYALTQSIDLEMEEAASMMSNVWWKLPDMAVCCSSSDSFMDDTSAMKLQIRHYSLLIFLHLPYLLRDREQRRYEYNRSVCMQASRDVLDRFVEYRKTFTGAISGRHVDYSALVAAMTLLLGYLGKRWPGHEAQLARDRALTEQVQVKMQEMGARNHDRLCIEAADTIRELLPIVQRSPSNCPNAEKNVHLNIPFLGTVNISAGPTPPESSASSVDMPHPPSPPPNLDHLFADENYIPPPPFSLSFDTPLLGQVPLDGGVGNYAEPDFTTAEWPCFTADLEDWALQGVDTSYWSMLNDSIT